ncbi:MAG: phasin family protein [Alcanivoracaceae bacterium]|nr:phasin family protein [Alcanivoracaceae bacterium]
MANRKQTHSGDEPEIDVPIDTAVDKDEKHNPIKMLTGGTRDLRKYTHQIWLAGLGAFARAEEEGSKLFDTLVDVGRDLEGKTRDISETRVEEIKERVKSRTGETMGKMEKAFDDRLNKALSKLGIPNKREVEALQKRVQELTATLESLSPEDEKKGK